MSKYQGWTNYETWAMNLWIQNEESSYRYWRECAKEAVAAGGLKRDRIYNLSQRIKDELDDQMPNVSGVWADLLTAAFGEVCWYEIADGMLDATGGDPYEVYEGLVGRGGGEDGRWFLTDAAGDVIEDDEFIGNYEGDIVRVAIYRLSHGKPSSA